MIINSISPGDFEEQQLKIMTRKYRQFSLARYDGTIQIYSAFKYDTYKNYIISNSQPTEVETNHYKIWLNNAPANTDTYYTVSPFINHNIIMNISKDAKYCTTTDGTTWTWKDVVTQCYQNEQWYPIIKYYFIQDGIENYDGDMGQIKTLDVYSAANESHEEGYILLSGKSSGSINGLSYGIYLPSYNTVNCKGYSKISIEYLGNGFKFGLYEDYTLSTEHKITTADSSDDIVTASVELTSDKFRGYLGIRASTWGVGDRIVIKNIYVE